MSSLPVPAFVLAALLVGSGRIAPAQVVVVDKGAFVITRDGTPAGREEFEIRRLPGIDGSTYEAKATVTLDGRTLHPVLSANAAGAPLAYRMEVRSGGEMVERATGQVSPGRIRVDAQSATSRSAREYGTGNGTLVLDDGVFHHYYFVARRAADAPTVPVLVPRRNVQLVLRASPSKERLAIGGRDVAATRLVLTEPGGAERIVWTDGDGRVLKVSLPSQKLTAVREELPR
ncbi:MAG TPA: hypothetical protein VFS08_07175 [Gemmatimonadaceae bacterium]|nr:hypothetical protein [Gemmatimonadaceae bacterium]